MKSTVNNISEIDEVKYPSKIHWSFGIGGFLDSFIISSFNLKVIFFYENEWLLSITLIGIAFLIYGLWNMINDPLLGWLSDKKTRFTEKWGRRFPWFMIGTFSLSLVYILVYTVPSSDQLVMFIWLLITIMLYEFFYSLWQINWLSVMPDKFRSHKERTKVGAIITIWNLFGNAFAFIISPMFITYGNKSSYISAAIVVSITMAIFTIFSIPGMKEDKELISRELRMIEKQEKERESFWQTVKFAIKHKNFMAYVLYYLMVQMFTALVIPSIPYWTRYVIQSKEPTVETLITVSFLLGSILSLPLWYKFGRKIGNRKVFIYGMLMVSILMIPLLFISDIISTMISVFLLGLGFGSLLIFTYPGFSDVIDDVVVKSGKRKEGIYTGIRTFIGRLAYASQGIIFAVVHQLTLYEPGAESQAPLAIWGIRVIMALIPIISFLIGFFIMIFIYDISPDKVAANKKFLEEQNL